MAGGSVAEEIVDAQLHIWGAETPSRPWPKGHQKPQRDVPFTAGNALAAMDRAGVGRAILVPPSWEGNYNDLVLDAAGLHPERFAAMGRIDLMDPHVRQKLSSWRDRPGMLGIRLTFRSEPEKNVLRFAADHQHIWGAAEDFNIPVYLGVPGLLPEVATLAKEYPNLRLAINHMGLFPKQGPAAFAAMPDLLALADYKNVAVILSAMPFYSTEPFPFRDVHPHVAAAVSAFGKERSFWGSDLTRLPCTYVEMISMIEEMDFIGAGAIKSIMGAGIRDWLGW